MVEILTHYLERSRLWRGHEKGSTDTPIERDRRVFCGEDREEINFKYFVITVPLYHVDILFQD